MGSVLDPRREERRCAAGCGAWLDGAEIRDAALLDGRCSACVAEACAPTQVLSPEAAAQTTRERVALRAARDYARERARRAPTLTLPRVAGPKEAA